MADYDWLALNVVQRLIREFYRLSDNVDSTLSDKYHFLIFNVNKTHYEQDYLKIGKPAHNVSENEQGRSKMLELAHNVFENEQGRSKMFELAHNVSGNEQGRRSKDNLAHKRDTSA